MTTHKVAELEGALLDAAVAKALGASLRVADGPLGDAVCYARGAVGSDHPTWKSETIFSPCSDWSDGGPLIERERIILHPKDGGLVWEAGLEGSLESSGPVVSFCGNGQAGPTPLIAAMRAFVASKFGDEVEL